MSTLKHWIRDVLLRLIHVTGAAWLYRQLLKRQGPPVRVICFHDVPDLVWFDSIVAKLTSKYHLVTPDQFHNREFHPNKINVLVTFDDGYQSWVEVALPVLQAHDIKAIFFITSGLLDAEAKGGDAAGVFIRDRLKLHRDYQPLSWDGARALVAAEHTIGGHTRTHASLGQLVETTEIQQEYLADKQRIETELSVSLKDFAYPFGTSNDFSEESIEALASVGAGTQYSACSQFVSVEDFENIIPRTLLEERLSIRSIHRWIGGGYDIFRAIISR